MLEIKILSDIYNEKIIDGEVHDVLVKKGLITKKFIDEATISTVEQYYNSKGTIYKSKCILTLVDGQTLVVKHPYDRMKKVMKGDRMIIKGFKK